jgi:hypothetical protein
MKKYLFIILFSFLLIPGVINASNANVSISAPSSVYIGDTVRVSVTVSSSVSLGSWQYNIGYDDSKLSYVSTTANSAQSVVGYAQGGGQSSITYSWTFKAISNGGASFSVSGIDVYAFDDESQMSIGGSTSTSINVVKPSGQSSGGSNSGGGSNKPSTQYKYSDDNNLSSLNVEGFELSFDSSVTEYSLSVPNDTKKVKIGATANDGKASVNGIGEYDVHEGSNEIEVVVTAENGDKKSYKINVVVKELSPIEVEVNGNKFNVVRKKDKLPSANATYKASTILIKGESVPCYHSDITDIYLIGLMNDKGEISLYKYDASHDKFSTYNEINVSGLFVSLIDSSDIPLGYKQGLVKIGDKEYDGYLKDGSYSLLYGVNLETGEKNYYSYDSSEGTLQKYLVHDSSDFKYSFQLIIGLACLSLFEFVMLIVSVVSKNKKMNKVLKEKFDTRGEYEKSFDSDKNEVYNDEDNITDDLTDEYLSSKTDAYDELSDNSNNLNASSDDFKYESYVDEEELGHTALISSDLNNVFNNSINKKELKRQEKKLKKKSKKINKKKNDVSDDDEMFNF